MNIKILDIKKNYVSDSALNSSFFNFELNHNLISSSFLKIRKLHSKERKAHKKNRSEVSCTTKKMYRQKGTGGARHGAASAPQFVGGGISHGPRKSIRNFSINKKEIALAKQMLLSEKMKTDKIFFVKDLFLNSISTKSALSLFSKFDSSVLIVSNQVLPLNQLLSLRNIQSKYKYTTLNKLNFYDILNYNSIIFDANLIDTGLLEVKNLYV